MPAPIRPVVRGRADPRSDPRFRRVVDKLDADSSRLKRHPTPAKKAHEPAKAAKGPPNEKAAGARVKQVDKLQETKTPKPEPTSFLAILQAEIAKAMPKTLGDTEKFMKGGSSEGMKNSLKGNVDQQKNKATGDLKQTSKQAPSESGVTAKPVTPIPGEPTPPAPQVDAPAAMPAPKSDAEVSLDASKQDVAGTMQEGKLTDTRLQKANDPRFSSVITAKDAVNKQADSAPGKYRASEAGTLARAAGMAVDTARKGVSMLLGAKHGNKAHVRSRQERQKEKEEQELKTFTAFVVSTFERTKKAVDDRLAALETKVNALFDKGVDTALASMKKYVEDLLFDYKMRRYLLQIGGSLLWIRDQFLSLPDEVNKFYEAGRKRFTMEMNVLAAQVANLVETELGAAKADVKRAQADIARAQKELSPSVQARAAKATAEYAEKFAELETSIEDKKQQLAEGLAQKYKEAFDKADESLKAIQDENKGLVARAKEKIAEVLKAIAEFKAKLMSVLRKAQNTLDLILEDPIQFLKNLLAAIKKGFGQFVDNIWTHLKAGFFKWLFGALMKLGIEPPTDLTLPSILKLVLSVLGITYAKMREKAVKLLGERAVAVIEKVVEYVTVLVKGGPAALWEKVKEDLSNLKQMVIDAIQDWLISTIVKKAVAKIVSLFNPVGAIIQAILLIYDVVKFIIEKAATILEFVEAVVDSIYNIATGKIDGAANYIEKSLANLVPILIGFLADLLGLGGVSEKIKEFIKKIQDKVDKAIDKVIAKIVEVVKKIVGAIKAGAQKLLNWWKKKVAIKGDEKPHTLTFEGEGKGASLVVKSAPARPSAFLKETADRRNISGDKQSGPIETAKTQEKGIGELQKKLGQFDENDKQAVSGKKMDNADALMESLDKQLGALGTHIGDTLVKWGASDAPIKEFKLPRSTFTVEQKRNIAARRSAFEKSEDIPSGKSALRANKAGEVINLQKGLARRHVVSSYDMADHYATSLKGKKWSEGKLFLEERGSISQSRTTVETPLNQERIVTAASKRYATFFGYAKNIFIGDSRENSQIQEKLDRGDPELADELLEQHVARIKREWAIDNTIKISGIDR